MNGQLLKEINFQILFRNLEHVLFCEIFAEEILLMECSDLKVESRCRWNVHTNELIIT